MLLARPRLAPGETLTSRAGRPGPYEAWVTHGGKGGTEAQSGTLAELLAPAYWVEVLRRIAAAWCRARC